MDVHVVENGEATSRARASAASENFTEEAADQAHRSLKIYRDASPLSAQAMQFAVCWLERAERLKLAIPLVPRSSSESFTATLERYGHGLEMPWQAVSIEYEHGGVYDAGKDLTHALSTRRIALCVRMESESAVTVSGLKDFVREPTDAGALLVWSVNYFDEKGEWEFAPAASIIPRHQTLDYLKQARSRGGNVIEKIRAVMTGLQRGAPAPERPMQMIFQDMLPELLCKLGPEHVDQAVRETSMDACWAALGTLSALACGNVEINASSRRPLVQGAARLGVPIDAFRGRVESDWRGHLTWAQEATAAPTGGELIDRRVEAPHLREEPLARLHRQPEV